MGEKTGIAWADHTFNPWLGCIEVSEECRLCYARELAERFGMAEWGKDAPRVVASEATWKLPRRWNAAAARAGRTARVFCASMADVFELRPDLEAPRARLWETIRETRHLTWMLLTKRPENIARMLPPWFPDAPDATKRRVWFGTTAGTQRTAEARIPHLLAAPVRVRFISSEPMLEALDFRPWLSPLLPGARRIDWIIFGGETDARGRFREMDPDWLRSGVEQCRAAGVAVFVKQDSGRRPGRQGRIPDDLWGLREFPEGRGEEGR